MNRPTPLPMLAVALAGGAFAGASVHVFLSTSPEEVLEETPPAVAAPGPELELLARVDELAQENRALHERLSELESRPVVVPRFPVDDFVTREELDALREELGTQAASEDALPLEPAALKDHVADALTTIRKEEKVDAVRKYHEKRVARLEEDVTKIEGWLELSPYQTDEMRTALSAHYEREAEQRRLWEEGAGGELLAEQKRSDGEEFRRGLERFLSETQLETFWEEMGRRGGK